MSTLTRLDFLAAYVTQYPSCNPLAIYCSVTGKQIATLTPNEADGLFSLVAHMDAESAADDWFTRQMASMRPSMQWNKLRLDSLNTLRKADPLGTLGYMMSRLFAPLPKPVSRNNLVELPSLDETIQQNYDRVKLMLALSRWNPILVKRVLYMLAVIDARAGLHTVTPPFTARELYTGTGANAFNMRAKLMTWYHDICNQIIARERTRETQSQFYRDGNPLAKSMHTSMFFESTGPRTDIIQRITESAENKRVRLARRDAGRVNQSVKAARQADRDFMADVLNGLMHESPKEPTLPNGQSHTQIKPAVKPRLVSFGKPKTQETV